MNNNAKLAELRHSLAACVLPNTRPSVPLGHAGADAVLRGGLQAGALHEVFAQDWGAGGFAICLAMLAAGKAPLFWVRPDYEAREYGPVSPPGLLELGGDPARLFLLRALHAADALAAAADILSCPHAGAVLLEIGGSPRILDLVASRRLALAAGESGVTVILLRAGAGAMPSAAATRWDVTSAPSCVGDDDWGYPRFAAQLVRHRRGSLGDFLFEWNPHHGAFNDMRGARITTPHHGVVVAAPAHRPAYAR